MQQGRRAETLVRVCNETEIAVRFWNIGGRTKFLPLLERFRSEFLLAHPAKISGLDWLIITKEQIPELQAFCRRNGLHIVEL